MSALVGLSHSKHAVLVCTIDPIGNPGLGIFTINHTSTTHMLGAGELPPSHFVSLSER